MSERRLLNPLLTDPGKLKREAAKRRNPNAVESISNSQVDEYLENGWEIDKRLKVKTRVRKPRECDETLENRVWLLFYLMGYPEISSGRGFKITIERRGVTPIEKQIDVFARDEETVVVVECKASKRVKKRSLQKDIEEFANLKSPISKAVKKHYGPTFKPKIIWLFVTSNIVWSDPDKQRALGENIRIITERELRYYSQISEHLRRAARFQFLAEFLKNQKIPELEGVNVPAIRGTIGGHKFYSFVSTPKQMLKIAFINHRSLNDPEGAPTYQRLVSRTRLRQISKFLNEGGYFPTNLLVNFTRKPRFEVLSKNEDAGVVLGKLFLPSRYRSAWVIDGQHRLYGFAPADEKHLTDNIMVVAFEELSKTEEANLFVTINHEQKSVAKTLLDELEGELKWESTVPTERIGAIGARLIAALNDDLGEALYGRVTQQGIPPTEKTCLTVPALKDGLKRSELIGKTVLNKKEYEPGPLCGVDDSQTLDRARSVLNSFLELLAASNPVQWDKGRKGHLCTNTALQGYFPFLGQLISYMESNKGLDARELSPQQLILEIEEYIDPVLKWLQEASDLAIAKKFKVQFGSGGPKEYYFRLCHLTKEVFSDFSPDGFDMWEAEQSSERIGEADRKLKSLNIDVQKFIFDIFKEKYGTEKDAYFEKGVIDKTIKTKAYTKSLDDDTDDRLPLENYLEFIEYKKIVEHKSHWPLFKAVFDIPVPAEKGYSKNIRWMDRINELRRIPAHATESRHYKVEDFEYIDYIFDKFETNQLNYYENEGS